MLMIHVTEHKITAHNVYHYCHGTVAQWEALVKAVARRRVHNNNLRRLIASYQIAYFRSNDFTDKLDEVTKAVFDESTWILARTIGEEEVVDPPHDFIDKLERLKSTMFNIPTHIGAVPKDVLVKLRTRTLLILEVSSEDTCMPLPKTSLESAETSETSYIIFSDYLVRMAEKHFPKLHDEVSKTFDGWSNRLFKTNDPGLSNSAAKFAFVAFALSHLSVSNCLHKNTGFVNGGDPGVSYVYKCMEKLAVELGYNSYTLKRFLYTDALDIADELAAHKNLPYDIVEAVSFTIQVLDNVLEDMMADRTYSPPRYLYEDVFVGMEGYGSLAYDTAETAPQSKAKTRTFDDEMEERRIDYSGALLSYPSVKMATKYAIANGYLSFQDAYRDLGASAYYAEQSEFVQKARAKIALENSAKRKARRKRSGILPSVPTNPPERSFLGSPT